VPKESAKSEVKYERDPTEFSADMENISPVYRLFMQVYRMRKYCGVTQGQSAQSKGLVVTRPELAYRPRLSSDSQHRTQRMTNIWTSKIAVTILMVESLPYLVEFLLWLTDRVKSNSFEAHSTC
jgi:hypothetical protein